MGSQEVVVNVYNPEMSVCVCGHVRLAHDFDGDWDGERLVASYGRCDGEGCNEDGTGNGVECGCEKFSDKELAQ